LVLPLLGCAARASAPRLSIANAGHPVERLSRLDRERLAQVGAAPDVRQLGSRAGLAFYSARGEGSGRCWAIGQAARGQDQPRFDSLACPAPLAGSFPSAATPVFDMSQVSLRPGNYHPLVNVVAGFAADRVAFVGVVAADRRVARWVAVRDNIYVDEVGPIRAWGLVARNRRGAIIWRYHFLVPRGKS
jgi:hypothetical protein